MVVCLVYLNPPADPKMVPRLRHRIGIETLRRELDASHQAQAAANVVAANNYATPPSSATSTLTTEDAWASNGYFAVPLDNPHKNYNPAVRDIIPGFRTSAGMYSIVCSSERASIGLSLLSLVPQWISL